MNFGGSFLQEIAEQRSSYELSEQELSTKPVRVPRIIPPPDLTGVLVTSTEIKMANENSDEEDDEKNLSEPVIRQKRLRERFVVRIACYLFAFVGILFLMLSLIFGLAFAPGVQTSIWAVSSIFLGFALALNTQSPREKRDPVVGMAGILITVTSFAAIVCFCIGLANPYLDRATMGIGLFESIVGFLLSFLWTYNVWYPNRKLLRVFKRSKVTNSSAAPVSPPPPPEAPAVRCLNSFLALVTILMWYLLAFLLMFFTYDVRGLVLDRMELSPPWTEWVGIGFDVFPDTPPAIPGIPATSVPTELPTSLPTLLFPLPTVSPSYSPSVSEPTTSPSDSPSQSSPTQMPTTSQPSISPSHTPTLLPTALPTQSPSRTPSANPTLPPTFLPTQSPSRTPTSSHPTLNPTVLGVPTKSPTRTPSNSPSAQPTHSFPTQGPTQSQPSTMPTFSQPSRMPSSSQPSAVPTTSWPSRMPTTSYPTTFSPTLPVVSSKCGTVSCCLHLENAELLQILANEKSIAQTVSEDSQVNGRYYVVFDEPSGATVSWSFLAMGNSTVFQVACQATRADSAWTFVSTQVNQWKEAGTQFSPVLSSTSSSQLSCSNAANAKMEYHTPSESFNFGYSFQTVSTTPLCLASNRPPPGDSVIDPGELHMVCFGNAQAQPVVLLEHDVSSTLDVWAWVQQTVASQTNPNSTYVCAYSRRGYGYSFPKGSLPRTPKKSNQELMEALMSALPRKTNNKFILVGHGLGGHYIQHFYQSFQANVSALVFVDARNADCDLYCQMDFGKRPDFEGYDLLRRMIPFGFIRASAGAGRYPSPVGQACVEELPVVVNRNLHDQPCRKRFLADLLNPQFWETSYDEETESPITCALVKNRTRVSVPMDVIVAPQGLYMNRVDTCGLGLMKLGGNDGAMVKSLVLPNNANHYNVLCNQPLAALVGKRILDMIVTVRREEKRFEIRTLTTMTFDQATSYCRSFPNGQLASISTKQHMFDVQAFLANFAGKSKVWIGLKRANSNSPFLWSRDSSPINTTLFPQGSSPGSGKDCAYISKGKWYPTKCSDKQYALCDIPSFNTTYY